MAELYGTKDSAQRNRMAASEGKQWACSRHPQAPSPSTNIKWRMKDAPTSAWSQVQLLSSNDGREQHPSGGAQHTSLWGHQDTTSSPTKSMTGEGKQPGFSPSLLFV